DADVEKQRRSVRGVVLSNIEGYHYVPAKTFIDATGDAVLANICGVTCRDAGRDPPNIMPATLPSLFAGIDWENPESGGKSQHVALSKALADKFFTQPDRHLPGMSQIGRTTGYLNGGHIFNLNALRTKSLTEGMMLGRRLAREYMEFYRKYVPGFEKIEHVTTASLMGVRESRRIVGEYELGERDYLARRQFPDQIGMFNKAIDIHPYNTSEEEFKRFEQEYLRAGRMKPGESFGIPYGILVPEEWKNLWVAGRCTSSDVAVHGSIRVQPAASMMGQAAGTAAVQSIRTGQPACDLDTEQLVTTLRKQNAYLPQKQLSKKMTRRSAA
ncbi:MAG: FAD-dependent oxidoreductase, partial [Bryobacteraceae bacterium]